MNNAKDFDGQIYDYLKDKFPNHKPSEYEEATAYITCKYIMAVSEGVNYILKHGKRQVRPRVFREVTIND